MSASSYGTALFGSSLFGGAYEVGADCWPVDVTACEHWADYAAGIKTAAIRRATNLLRVLVGYRLGGCPVTLRPIVGDATRVPLQMCGPLLRGGQWYNSAPQDPTAILLPSRARAVSDVYWNGQMLSAGDYRVDGRVVRLLDGRSWLLNQDVSLDVTVAGTCGVDYLTGLSVDSWGAYVAGMLACEFALQATGSKACRLPANATSLTRLGLSMTFDPKAAPETSIPEVDEYVARWNPQHLVADAQVWSPDLDRRFAEPINGSAVAGSDGRSAYEVAVANGFVGTESAWLASLVGTPGSPGSGQALVYPQVTPALQWVIAHTFNRDPAVSTFDTSGNAIYGDVVVTNTYAYITWTTPTAGTAVLT